MHSQLNCQQHHFQCLQLIISSPRFFFFFFFNDTATTEIYTLSLHDALPIYHEDMAAEHALFLHVVAAGQGFAHGVYEVQRGVDRKSTRLNSSHLVISYAVFCLKKKKKTISPSISRKNHPRQHSTRLTLSTQT